MKRTRNDSIKSGVGIDGSEGERYSKTGAVDPWNSNPRGNFIDKKGVGAYTSNDSGLTNKMPDEDYAEQGKYNLVRGRDILDQVEANQSDSGNRAIKSGRKS